MRVAKTMSMIVTMIVWIAGMIMMAMFVMVGAGHL